MTNLSRNFMVICLTCILTCVLSFIIEESYFSISNQILIVSISAQMLTSALTERGDRVSLYLLVTIGCVWGTVILPLVIMWIRTDGGVTALDTH